MRVCNWKLFFLSYVVGTQKNHHQWDRSFEHPKHMFKLMDKNIIAILLKLILPNWLYAPLGLLFLKFAFVYSLAGKLDDKKKEKFMENCKSKFTSFLSKFTEDTSIYVGRYCYSYYHCQPYWFNTRPELSDRKIKLIFVRLGPVIFSSLCTILVPSEIILFTMIRRDLLRLSHLH